jgi:hypothetical protein
MFSTPLIRHILRDEAVTRGLGDVEARMIVEWLVARAEAIDDIGLSEGAAWAMMRQALRRARAITLRSTMERTKISRGSDSIGGCRTISMAIPLRRC